MSHADWLEAAFAEAGNARVGCGFITWKMAEDPEVLADVLSRARTALCLSFGDPAPFAPCIRDAGVPLICQVTTLADAIGDRVRGLVLEFHDIEIARHDVEVGVSQGFRHDMMVFVAGATRAPEPWIANEGESGNVLQRGGTHRGLGDVQPWVTRS